MHSTTTSTLETPMIRERLTIEPVAVVTTSHSAARLVPLDVLRFIALFLVLGHHVIVRPESAVRLAPAAIAWSKVGWTGVDLFFVLSGFLIGGLLFREFQKTGNLNVKRFMVRRGFKIWPLYLGYVLILTITALVRWHTSFLQTCSAFWPFYLHVQNYHTPYWLYHDFPVAHLWSLAIEEHFYLVLPFVLLLLRRTSSTKEGGLNADGLRAFPVVAIFVLCACLALRLANAYIFHLKWSAENYQWPTHLRIDSLIAGVLLSYMWHYHPQRLMPLLRRPLLLMIAGSALVLWVGLADIPALTCTVGYTLLYLGYGCILLAFMVATLPTKDGKDGTELKGNRRWSALLNGRVAGFLATLGGWSYATYLFHIWFGKMPSFYLLYHNRFAFGGTFLWVLVTVLYLTTSFALGGLIATLIEKPTLALRNRLFPT